ncbi:MAG: hypothetical protein ACFCVG_04120 [Kineosporiaceae bacterium]
MTTGIDSRSDDGTGRSLRARFDRVVAAEFAAQPMAPGAAALVASDLAGLPDPVRRYIERQSGAGHGVEQVRALGSRGPASGRLEDDVRQA